MVDSQLEDTGKINKLMILLLGYLFGLRLIVTCFTGFSAYTKDTKEEWLKFLVFFSWYIFGLYSTFCNIIVIGIYEMVCNRHLLLGIRDRLDIFLAMAVDTLETIKENKIEETMSVTMSMANKVVTGLNWFKTSCSITSYKLDLFKKSMYLLKSMNTFIRQTLFLTF